MLNKQTLWVLTSVVT